MGRSKRKPKFTNCGFVAHGKSEWHIAKYTFTNLHIRHQLFAKSNGKSSIQINGLMAYLNKICRNLKSFAEEYCVEYDSKTKRLVNFKLFIMMDTDDCSEQAAKDFQSKKMFAGHPLYDYIVPLFCIRNLEEVMVKAGIMTKKIPDNQKDRFYSKVFPMNDGKHGEGTAEEIRHFGEQVRPIKETNLEELIDYCLKQIEQD